MTLSLEKEQIWLVSELSIHLKKTIENSFKDIQVQGEISGLKQHTSGHWYFSLKDRDCVVDCVCWRGTALSIALSEGLEVVAKGRLTIYTGRSKYQLIVENAKASGEGALLKLLLERKEKFKKEGLFDNKKKLPEFPQRIGVVTSLTGAVIKDILHRLNERYPCHVLVWPVLVQGAGAAEQIASAIDGFNRVSFDLRPDLLIIARGGGSIEDLWAFNEEIVVRATAQSLIPTISAIGHETDTTLIDYAADRRAPTPTAAAEIASPDKKVLHQSVKSFSQRLSFVFDRFFKIHVLKVNGIQRLLRDPKNFLDTLLLRLDDWSERLRMLSLGLLEKRTQSLFFTSSNLEKIFIILEGKSAEFYQISQVFKFLQERYFREQLQTVLGCEIILNKLSPNEVLKRGYCWITAGDNLVSSARDLEEKLPISCFLNFSDGKLRVKAIKA